MPENNSLLVKPVADYETLDLTRLLNMVYMDMENQISRADTKAQIILSANAILLAIFANTRRGFSFSSISVLAGKDILAIIMTLVLLILLILSVYFAVSATFPRKGTHSTHISLAFSQHIASLSPEGYVDLFMNTSLQEMKRMVIHQIHAKAGVVTAKFRAVSRSIVFFMLAITLWAVSEIVISFL
nr:hypothetical protein [Anaerolineae bacterium]